MQIDIFLFIMLIMSMTVNIALMVPFAVSTKSTKDGSGE